MRHNHAFLSHPKFHTSQRFRSVEKSEKVRIMSPFSPSHDPSVILYLVLHFSEVWKCGIVWQSKDNVTLFPWSRTLCYSLLSSTLLRGVEVWKNDKALMTGGIVRQYPYFVRLFHTSTPLRSTELRLVKNDKGFMTGRNVRQYPYLLFREYSTLPNLWEVWN